MSAARRVVVVAVVVVVLKAGVRCEADIVPDGYQQDLRPTSKNGGPINVGISIKINSVTEVNLEQMSILFEMYFRVAWKDPRLVFPQSYVNASSDDPEGTSTTQQKKTTISVLPKFLKKVWVPDLYIRGTRSIDTFFILQEFQGVTISSDFTVFTSIMMQLRLVCGMVFHTYPFDTQECTIYVTSYGYTLNEMTFKWMPPGLGTDDLERHLAGYDFSVKSLNGTMCLCVKCTPQWSACLRVHLVLRRQSFIHIMSSYVPSGLFVVVGWTSFFWPAEVVPGRTVLVITSLLTITSMYTGIRQTSPTTSYVKAIDVWMLTCILFTTMPLLQYALILSWRKTREVSSVTKVVPDVSLGTRLSTNPFGRMNSWVNYAPTAFVRDRTRASGFVVRRANPCTTEAIKKKSESTAVTGITFYEARKRKAELVGRIGLPVCFLLFNFVYWPFYLTSNMHAID